MYIETRCMYMLETQMDVHVVESILKAIVIPCLEAVFCTENIKCQLLK